MSVGKIEYNETISFKKDFEKISRKFQSLKEDLAIVKKNSIEPYHLKMCVRTDFWEQYMYLDFSKETACVEQKLLG